MNVRCPECGRVDKRTLKMLRFTKFKTYCTKTGKTVRFQPTLRRPRT